MVNIADLDYSARVNSGMRPVLCFFPVYYSPYEENQKGCSSDKPLLGPKIPPRPYAENILKQKWLILQILISLLMPFLEWDKYKIFFLYFISPMKRIRRCAYQTNPFWVPRGTPKYPRGMILMQKWWHSTERHSGPKLVQFGSWPGQSLSQFVHSGFLFGHLGPHISHLGLIDRGGID